jgi:transposase
MWNQENSKVTEDYLNKLKSKLKHQNDLTTAELRSQLLLDIGIDITKRRVQQILKNLGYIKKRKTLLYEDADLPIIQQRTKNFVHSYDLKSTKI